MVRFVVSSAFVGVLGLVSMLGAGCGAAAPMTASPTDIMSGCANSDGMVNVRIPGRDVECTGLALGKLDTKEVMVRERYEFDESGTMTSVVAELMARRRVEKKYSTRQFANIMMTSSMEGVEDFCQRYKASVERTQDGKVGCYFTYDDERFERWVQQRGDRVFIFTNRLGPVEKPPANEPASETAERG